MSFKDIWTVFSDREIIELLQDYTVVQISDNNAINLRFTLIDRLKELDGLSEMDTKLANSNEYISSFKIRIPEKVTPRMFWNSLVTKIKNREDWGLYIEPDTEWWREDYKVKNNEDIKELLDYYCELLNLDISKKNDNKISSVLRELQDEYDIDSTYALEYVRRKYYPDSPVYKRSKSEKITSTSEYIADEIMSICNEIMRNPEDIDEFLGQIQDVISNYYESKK